MNRGNLNDLFFRLIEGRADRTKTIAGARVHKTKCNIS